jgi:hypothetical protein
MGREGGGKLMSDENTDTQPEPRRVEPIWGVVAKVVKERPYGPGGKESRRGTRKFNAGQKVYLWDVFWGMGGEDLTVIGRYRGKYGYITSSLRTAYLTDFRAELIYSPTIIRRIIYGYTDRRSKFNSPEYIAKSWKPLDGSEEFTRRHNN